MNKLSRICVVLLMLVIALGGCARQKPEKQKAKQLETAVNLITSTVPVDGALGVLENSSIVLNFAQAMDKTLVQRSLSLFSGS